MKAKTISILGSTGSIGQSTLSVVERFPDRFKVAALAAGNNLDILEQQIRRFRPSLAAIAGEGPARELRKRCSGIPVRILSGVEGMIEVAAAPEADMTVSAIVGTAGLVPTMAAIRAGKVIALANKEVLVTAGEFVMAECKRRNVTMLPVDSEHSAIFQCLHAGEDREVRELVITASGGPFRCLSQKDLNCVTTAQALKHPNWSMGRKITVDSATLMNKGLEVIEARWLFGITGDRIKVLVHPQSIVHSMVAYHDGSMVAQLGVPDMKGPIAYALSYPERLEGVAPLPDLVALGTLTFEEPDTTRFPCLAYAYEALKAGGSMPAVLSAANEIAVKHFLDEKIGFMDISRVIRSTMDAHQPAPIRSVEDALKADSWARLEAEKVIESGVSKV
ncbi:MAG: 1-deoxy-D-xylulose-5-phosphate reductoisomerase [Nitrospirae bacterium GWC2_57_13]|jgi:1-deoxy-D-xylulose-5-phosphate reductoisomerase|nr:MAG: 1-deoxy-D-xylulose-5-phosphate reductoisomerase [Nitrospirae bacterium GWC2_57_13]OGW45585.1 MAG: 1-deoxy-D-xylulose-5-phosphate reductoisomerase [Nitrospirae bacterium GWD2_57_8]HAR45863.1 1-deoxy-D-xylulose-5-phosphate reductoisomerase [Nitrospiraceae bacterium]